MTRSPEVYIFQIGNLLSGRGVSQICSCGWSLSRLRRHPILSVPGFDVSFLPASSGCLGDLTDMPYDD